LIALVFILVETFEDDAIQFRLDLRTNR